MQGDKQSCKARTRDKGLAATIIVLVWVTFSVRRLSALTFLVKTRILKTANSLGKEENGV